MKVKGRPKSEIQTTVVIDRKLLNRLKRRLKAEDLSVSRWFRQQVRRYLGESPA